MKRLLRNLGLTALLSMPIALAGCGGSDNPTTPEESNKPATTASVKSSGEERKVLRCLPNSTSHSYAECAVMKYPDKNYELTPEGKQFLARYGMTRAQITAIDRTEFVQATFPRYFEDEISPDHFAKFDLTVARELSASANRVFRKAKENDKDHEARWITEVLLGGVPVSYIEKLQDRWLSSIEARDLIKLYSRSKNPEVYNCMNKNITAGDLDFSKIDALIASGRTCQTASYDPVFGAASIDLAYGSVNPGYAKAYWNAIHEAFGEYGSPDSWHIADAATKLFQGGVTIPNVKRFISLNQICGTDIDADAMVAYRDQGVSFDEIASIARKKALEESVAGKNNSLQTCTPSAIQRLSAGNYDQRQK